MSYDIKWQSESKEPFLLITKYNILYIFCDEGVYDNLIFKARNKWVRVSHDDN